MSKSVDKKNAQLGMSVGTASNRLRKMLMFDLIVKCNLNTCYQCNCKILSVKDLSIDHKIPYLDSVDPIGLFFNIDNIAFSHLKCNSGARREGIGRIKRES